MLKWGGDHPLGASFPNCDIKVGTFLILFFFFEVFFGKGVQHTQDSQGTIFCATAILLNIEHTAITRGMRAVSLDAPRNRRMTKLLRGFASKSCVPRFSRRLISLSCMSGLREQTHGSRILNPILCLVLGLP